MGKSEVKLLGAWPSPFALRVRIALHLKSINYELIEEDLLGPKSELVLKSNPFYKKIPVLFHDGNTILESQIILQYIDEVWPSAPSILPSDAAERANSRFWVAYFDDKVCSCNLDNFNGVSLMNLCYIWWQFFFTHFKTRINNKLILFSHDFFNKGEEFLFLL